MYRGGVSFRSSEPDYELARGHNCEEVCTTIYEKFKSAFGQTVIYAKCTYEALGNGELVAQSTTDMYSMITNVGTTRAQFLSACAGIFQL